MDASIFVASRMKKSAWTKAAIESERELARAALELSASDERAKLEACIAGATGSDPGVPLVRRFHFVVSALAIFEAHGGLSTAQVSRLIDVGKSLLRVASINPTSSLVSYLYGELHGVVSRVLVREGRHFEGFWERQMAHHLSRRSPLETPAARLLASAASNERLGLVRLSREQLVIARTLGLSPTEETAAQSLEFRLLWFGSREDELAAKTNTSVADESVARELNWLCFWVDAKRTRSLAPLLGAIASGRHERFRFVADLWLASRVATNADWQTRVPSSRQLKSAFEHDSEGRAEFERLYDAICLYEQACDKERPLERRMRSIQRFLAESPQVARLETELLMRAAAVRWLVQFNQMELATHVLESYRASCRQLSDGRDEDLFGFLSDLSTDALLRRYAKSK